MDAKPLTPLEERWATWRRVPLRYFAAGDGSAAPLVLVDGLGGAASNWHALAPRIAQTRRILVPELPGHGGSAPLAAATSLAAFADAVAAVLAAEGVRRAAFVGHSMGGAVALRLALRRPPLVERLVLASGAGISSGTREAERALRIIGLLKPGKRTARFAERTARSRALRTVSFFRWGAADPSAMPPEVAKGFLTGPGLHTDTWSAWQALVAEDMRPELHEIMCPVLVLWGADDHQLPLDDAFDYARRLRAPLRTIPDCGHLLIGERPDACLDAILGFLGAGAP